MPSLTVLSWNCLADAYAPPTPVFSTRRTAIAAALTAATADIVTLQEVDHYRDFYHPLLTSLGYIIVYAPRPSRPDGVLIAVKPALRVLSHHLISFDDLARGPAAVHLRRHNVALILLLEHGRVRLSVSTAHLYWNPARSNVKLAQARYLLHRLSYVRERTGLPPPASILTGDFNSLPDSAPYRSLTRGAPMAAVTGACVSAAVRGAVCGVRRARGEARFLCDGSLSRLARWLRLLGVDAALEEGHGGRRNVDALFERARRERRILVTSSTTVCRRANCPESFFVRPGKMGQMETCLTTLLNCYGVRLEEDMILSMCGKCGEAIERRGEGGPKDTELFTCGGCGWVYWESTSGKGSSVKARKLAKRLYKAVEEGRRKAGAEVRRRERCSNEFRGGLKDCDCTAQEGRRGEYWLRYESAFATVHGREPEYTNVNGDFKGTLDYIFVGGTAKVTAAEVIETVVGGGWPSDHSMVKAEVSVEELPVGRAGFSRTRSCPLW